MKTRSNNRRLAAILAADVVGYSKLMGADQEGTLDALRQLRDELFDPIVTDHRGDVVKRMGDGWIVEFPSISDAVTCAQAIQDGLADNEKIKLRVGIHTGEMVFEEDDVFGDGVNIAARLEALADPGQVLISDTAYNSLDAKAGKQFQGGEDHQLKNIDRAVGVWRWPVTADSKSSLQPKELPLPDKPSIAVLPFDNMSIDPEQEFFADGLVEDVTTALSRYSELFVTSRSSAFSYKGKKVDLRTISQELGVRYLLEGSVRRAGRKLRVTAQLIESASDSQVWSHRFDRNVDDLFDIQDEITVNVAGEVVNEIERVETTRVSRKNISDLNAWERLMKGLWYLERGTAEGNVKSQEIFRTEVARSETGATAHAWLLAGLGMDLMYGFSGRKPADLVEEGLAAGRLAIARDGNSEIARAWLSVFSFIAGEHDKATTEARTAIRLNPNLALGYRALGYVLAHSGPQHVEEACECLDQAIKLGPRDHWTPMCHANKAMAYLIAKQHEASIACSQLALSINPEFSTALRLLAAAYARSGQYDEASMFWKRAEMAGQVNLEAFKASIFRILKRPEDAEHYYGGLKLAGMDI